MKKHGVVVASMAIAEKLKPLLTKILPIGLLRSTKKKLISATMKSVKGEFLPFNRHLFSDGVNLIGYIQGEVGLGQSCRLVADSLEASGVNFAVYNYEQVSNMRMNDQTWTHKITNTAPHNINLIHINPYEMPLAYFRMGRSVWDSRHTIAFWLWELEKFPQEWESSFNLVDEIWTPSEFAAASIRNATAKPVRIVPYALTVPTCGAYERDRLNLPPDTVLFLCMFDSNSVIWRKNPMGTIEAYKKAFSKTDTHVGLVIKTNNLQKSDLAQLKKELNGYPNIRFITEILDKPQVNALIACVDVFVSLHRAEGFGLVPAEAMLLGTPVIATNWSANAEFMNSEVACMVDCTLVPITQDRGPYKAGNRWAEPDVTQAAAYMRQLSTDEKLRTRLSEKAAAHIKRHFAPEKAAAIIQKRIAEIYAQQTHEGGTR